MSHKFCCFIGFRAPTKMGHPSGSGTRVTFCDHVSFLVQIVFSCDIIIIIVIITHFNCCNKSISRYGITFLIISSQFSSLMLIKCINKMSPWLFLIGLKQWFPAFWTRPHRWTQDPCRWDTDC